MVLERPGTGTAPRAGLRLRLGLLLGAVLLAASRALSWGPEPGTSVPPTPAPGALVPIDVEAGRARFRFSTPGPASKFLVVVSALSRDRGPFPIRLEARPSTAEPTPLPPPAVLTLRPTPTPPTLAAPATEPAVTIPAPTRVFSMLARDGDPASASNYRPVAARLRAVGERVQVYVDDRDLARVAPETLRAVVATFDRTVYPLAVRCFGPARDVDGDGRFSILISGRVGAASPDGGVDGFVRAADFDPGLPAPFGNRADVLYLDAALRPGPHMETVIAHEYTHAVTFSRRLDTAARLGRPPCDEEGWIEEGTAHLVEDLQGGSRSNIDYRVSAFLSAPERYRLIVRDYYAADLFRSHGNRGSTYLFLRWCAERLGPGFLPALVGSAECGVANLEAAAGARFDDLYRQWSASLYLDALAPGSEPDPGAWPIAGPRASLVEPGGAPEVWSAEGTSSHFAVVRASSTGVVEVEVEGPAAAALQVTAVRLPDGLPCLALDASLRPGDDGAPRLTLALSERDGRAVRVEAIAWEPIVPSRGPTDPGFRRGELRGLPLAETLGTLDLPPLGRLESRPIPLPGIGVGDGPILVKLLGVDLDGRRVSAWAELNP